MFFANDTLRDHLAPALLHAAARTPVADDATQLHVWEGAPSAEESRLFPADHFVPEAEVRLRGDGYILSYREDRSIFTAWFPAERRGFVRVRSARDLPRYEKGCPMRTFFHWWLESRGLAVVHCGAVGISGRGVLLAGKAGLGKSTCAFACLRAGLDYAGDDYTAVHVSAGRVEARALYGSVKLESAHLRAIASGMPLTGEALDNGKELLFVDKVFPGRLAASLDIRAVLIPHRTGYAETVIRPVSPVRCLTALAPSTIFQLRSRGAAGLTALSDIVRGLPCYTIEMGRNIADIPIRVRELLTESA